jgi:hypothetical protein
MHFNFFNYSLNTFLQGILDTSLMNCRYTSINVNRDAHILIVRLIIGRMQFTIHFHNFEFSISLLL